MANSIVQSQQPNQSSPFDAIRHFDEQGNEFWYARELQKILGYTSWQKFKQVIEVAGENLETVTADTFREILPVEVKSTTKPLLDYKLTRLACYHIALACDSRGNDSVKSAKHYFVVKTRQAEVVIPAQNDRLRELELENENLKLKSGLIDKTSTLVAMYGEELGLTIAGLNVGQIIEVKIPTTETLNPVTGHCQEYLDAKQLAVEVARRSGQKVKNADFIRKLKAANRDDLIIPITRNSTCEYVKPENLDEAISVVYGNSRQQLLVPQNTSIANV
jgi:hypothetical protein